MNILTADLAEFEDPAPQQANGIDEEPKNLKRNDSRATKNKLPFKADIELSSRKYKGERKSRSDVGLDTETLGILDETEDVERKEQSSADDIGDDSDMDDDVLLNDEDSESDEEVDSDIPIEPVGGRGSNGSRLNGAAHEEERAVLDRLKLVEKEEEDQANGIRKQKELYDAVVNFRIRIEAMMAIARTFPDQAQRENCDTLWTGDEVEEELNNAQSALARVENETNLNWRSSWAHGGSKGSDAEFEKWRDSVLNHWGKKVNEASGLVPKGGFKAFDTSVTAQMNASLASGKHINRTRRVKEAIDLIGGVELPEGTHEIHFDDGELYRTLLREIIESGDGTGGGLRYAQLSKSGKVKKKVSRGFAKGKRLRYDVHEKLVGFLAPIPLPDPGPVDEIIASLFGKRGTVTSS